MRQEIIKVGEYLDDLLSQLRLCGCRDVDIIFDYPSILTIEYIKYCYVYTIEFNLSDMTFKEINTDSDGFLIYRIVTIMIQKFGEFKRIDL